MVIPLYMKWAIITRSSLAYSKQLLHCQKLFVELDQNCPRSCRNSEQGKNEWWQQWSKNMVYYYKFRHHAIKPVTACIPAAITQVNATEEGHALINNHTLLMMWPQLYSVWMSHDLQEAWDLFLTTDNLSFIHTYYTTASVCTTSVCSYGTAVLYTSSHHLTQSNQTGHSKTASGGKLSQWVSSPSLLQARYRVSLMSVLYISQMIHLMACSCDGFSTLSRK